MTNQNTWATAVANQVYLQKKHDVEISTLTAVNIFAVPQEGTRNRFSQEEKTEYISEFRSI